MSATKFTPGPWDVRGHWGTFIFCIVKGLNPDSLAWHVGARCLHLNREHVGPGHRDRCSDCGATSYVRSHDARVEWEAAR